jgi:putative acetyltransferase
LQGRTVLPFLDTRAVMLQIRTEIPSDRAAIAAVHGEAFGRDDEPRLVDRLRAAGQTRLSLVAEQDGTIVGHVLFSQMAIETDSQHLPALALAPVAVLPAWQRRGIGARLIERGVAECRALGHSIVIVLGNPRYYRRFGFSAQRARPLESPYAGDAFMALELVEGALDGVSGRAVYPPAFAEL